MSGYTYDPAAAQARYNQRVADANNPYQPATTPPNGIQPPPPDSIANYRPKSHLGWYILIGALLIVAIVVGILLNNLASPQAKPTPTPSQPVATDTRTGGLPFSDGGQVAGYWQITRTAWTSDSVTVTVEIQLDSGTLRYEFYAYDNVAGSTIEPTYDAPDSLVPGFLGPGQSITGTLTFASTQQAMTLVLASDNAYTQLSALTIPT